MVLDAETATGLADETRRRIVQRVSVERKPYTRRPYPPFRTATLQQEAGRKFRFGARRTMSAAQRLYEGGFITYMRTDSTNLSGTALERGPLARRRPIRQGVSPGLAPFLRQEGERCTGGTRGDPSRR